MAEEPSAQPLSWEYRVAAVRLNQLGADRLMEDFVTRYPTSTKRNSAFLDVADYYFENGKYHTHYESLEAAKKSDPEKANQANKTEVNTGAHFAASIKYNIASSQLTIKKFYYPLSASILSTYLLSDYPPPKA